MKILCPKCEGRKTVLDAFANIVTLGLAILLDNKVVSRKKCPRCDGKGYLVS